MTITAKFNAYGTIDAEIDGVSYSGLPAEIVKTFLRDPQTDEVTENFVWSSGNRYRQMVADEYENQGLEIPAYVHIISPQEVDVEKDRRLALGFTYDFGDARGAHEIGTTDNDMKGWDEVTVWADTKLKLDQADATTIILTNTGPATITPMEWYHILDRASGVRQLIWQAAFTLAAQSPIPADFANDSYWTA